jgi:hypothetical protein
MLKYTSGAAIFKRDSDARRSFGAIFPVSPWENGSFSLLSA